MLKEELKYIRKIILFSSIIVIAILTGTLLYHKFEGLSFFESFYMTIITISTVGYSEIRPMSVNGRIISIFIIIFSMTTIAFAVGSLLQIISSGELNRIYKKKRKLKMIRQLKNHFIICGFGRIGRLIAEELSKNDVNFVIVDTSLDEMDIMSLSNYHFLHGDATNEDTLIEAGIMTAKGLIAAVRNEADNVYITLTAKGILPSLYVLARATDENAEKKLKRAGADRVMLPYTIGGQRMAQAVIRPNVVDFLDFATLDNKLDLGMEEIAISEHSKLVGKNLIESNLRKDYGIIIIAVNKSAGEMVYNPSPLYTIESGDNLIILGNKSEITSLRKVICRK